jgi:hypothetical protein
VVLCMEKPRSLDVLAIPPRYRKKQKHHLRSYTLESGEVPPYNGTDCGKLDAAAGEIRCGPYHYGRHSCCFRTVAHVERCRFERWLVWRSVAVGSKRLLFPVRPSVDHEFIIS